MRVYRKREEPVRPSRTPRDGFDIEADGRYRHLQPGPDDAPRAAEGRWWAEGEGIRLTEPGAVFEVVAAARGELKMRPA